MNSINLQDIYKTLRMDEPDLQTIYYAKNIPIYGVKSSEQLCDNHISFTTDDWEKYRDRITINSAMVIPLGKKPPTFIFNLKDVNFILAENPKYVFVKIANMFKKLEDENEKNCVIGNNFKSGDNCVLKNCVIGNNVKIHSGTIIGEDGFGYIRKNKLSTPIQFPHFGKAIIEDDVNIHSLCVIDRGALCDTIIHKGVKIDNYVHIGHNSEIGENTIITSKTLVAGSTKVGSNCFIGPGSLVIDRISIANNTTLGMGSVVIKSILKEGQTWAGNPARRIR